MSSVTELHVFCDRTSHMFSDRTLHVFSDRTSHVFSDRTLHMFSDRTLHVFSDRTSHVFSDRTSHAFRDRASHVFSERTSHAFRDRTSHVFSDNFTLNMQLVWELFRNFWACMLCTREDKGDALYQLQRLLGDTKTKAWFNPTRHWLPYILLALILNRAGNIIRINITLRRVRVTVFAVEKQLKLCIVSFCL
jgi:hypothetical protein